MIRSARILSEWFVVAGMVASLAACKNKDQPKPVPDEPVMAEDRGEPSAPASQDRAPAVSPPEAPSAASTNPEPAPREFTRETDPDEVEGWRPAWWLEDPMKTQQHAIACAYATDAELAKARGLAVDYARQRLTQSIGHEPRSTAMKTDAVRLPSGEYRAFVLVQTPLK